MSASIKVAVRCRPFSIDDKLGVKLHQQDEENGEVELINCDYSTTRFPFTYAWWSAYGFKVILLSSFSLFLFLCFVSLFVFNLNLISLLFILLLLYSLPFITLFFSTLPYYSSLPLILHSPLIHYLFLFLLASFNW